MRVAWLSDLHLNFVRERDRRRFADRVAAKSPDAVLISGDISDGWTVVPALALLAERVHCPTYFVLGNHDFYHRGIADVRAEVRAAIRDTSLVYLPDAGAVPLCPGVALVWHDGWADGRNGDFATSTFVPHDFTLIHDFQVFDGSQARLRLMQSLANEAADYFSQVLPAAATANPHIIALTHVPPFAGASSYRGRPSTPDLLPFYSSRCIGDAILAAMADHPSCQATVLAGHTHGRARYEAAPNVHARVPDAVYGRPRIAELFQMAAWVLGRGRMG
jgi:predicted phosphodiesterase